MASVSTVPAVAALRARPLVDYVPAAAPVHRHDCTRCCPVGQIRVLGVQDDAVVKNIFDGYYCSHATTVSLVLRYGSGPTDYVSRSFGWLAAPEPASPLMEWVGQQALAQLLQLDALVDAPRQVAQHLLLAEDLLAAVPDARGPLLS